MAFETREISNADGEPVVLYEFKLGETYYRYCTDSEEVTAGRDELGNPATWAPSAVLDEGISQGGNDQSDVMLEIESSAAVSQLFRQGRPSGKLFLWIKRWHKGDPVDEVAVEWIGSVTNAILISRAKTSLNCRSIAGSYDRNGLRLFWSRMCPHVLYGIGCRLDKNAFAYPFDIATVTGDRFTVDAFVPPDEGTFSGGFLEFNRGDGSFERLGIQSQDGNDFQVLGRSSGLTPGLTVTLYPGCNRTTTVCKLFGNLKNYGGFPHMPGKSPFDGSPVF